MLPKCTRPLAFGLTGRNWYCLSLQLRLLPLQPQVHLLLMQPTHLLPQDSVLVSRKLYWIVSRCTVFIWLKFFFLWSPVRLCVFPGHTIRELLSSSTEKATMRVLTILRHWVTKHPEVRIVCKYVCCSYLLVLYIYIFPSFTISYLFFHP